MNPRFFGSSEAPLFGIYHPASGARPRDEGVLLCYPAPQEYMRTHWAFRKLAAMLTKKGLHVLRFDYFGTGDSAGESDQVSLAEWRKNVVTAANELRDMASIRKVSAVGFRLGAAVAATTEGAGFHTLVLWEPVIDGGSYLAELEAIQKQSDDRALEPPWATEERPPELLGFAMPRAMEAEIRAIDLSRAPAPKASRVAVMVSNDRPIARELHDSLTRKGVAATFQYVPESDSQGGSTELQAALLSNEMLNAITAFLG